MARRTQEGTLLTGLNLPCNKKDLSEQPEGEMQWRRFWNAPQCRSLCSRGVGVFHPPAHGKPFGPDRVRFFIRWAGLTESQGFGD